MLMTNLLKHCEVIKLNFIKITSKSVKLADCSDSFKHFICCQNYTNKKKRSVKNGNCWKY